MSRPSSRRSQSTYSTPSPQSSPRPSSAFEEDIADSYSVTMLGPDSRPASETYTLNVTSNASSSTLQPPSLTDILMDVALPPWTLGAFMAYLSQNHCMETLEFTLDSQRYATFYEQLVAEPNPSRKSITRVCTQWEKLMQVYIVPCAPREVNIPARVRDNLLSVAIRPNPPHPSHLDDAGRIVFELMNDSLLVPFIESVAPSHLDCNTNDRSHYSQRPQSSVTFSKAYGSSGHHTLSNHVDMDDLTDDSDSHSPYIGEPMTPPTTPPLTDWAFHNHQPGGIQRAVAAHSKSWKKMGEKLGFSRKHSNRGVDEMVPSSKRDSMASDSSESRRYSGSL